MSNSLQLAGQRVLSHVKSIDIDIDIAFKKWKFSENSQEVNASRFVNYWRYYDVSDSSDDYESVAVSFVTERENLVIRKHVLISVVNHQGKKTRRFYWCPSKGLFDVEYVEKSFYLFPELRAIVDDIGEDILFDGISLSEIYNDFENESD